jgi:hypothetical protein
MAENPSGDDMATTSSLSSCPVCGTPFVRVRRQRYCSDTCRRTAWRRRHAAVQPEPALIPATRRRRDSTVYECGDCDEPVAIADLLTATETPAEREVITMPDR